MTDTALDNIITALTGEGETRISVEDLKATLSRYPFFTLPIAAALRDSAKCIDEKSRAELTRMLALSSPDPSTLYMLLEPGGEAHRNFYPDETPPPPSTEAVIDSFLENYGTTSPQEEEILNRLIFNPTPDYAQILAKEEESYVPDIADAAPGSDDDKLNRFIISRKQAEGATPAPEHAPAIGTDTVANRVGENAPQPQRDDSLLSESLAKIFIKQRQYTRAYEIINQLNLKFPEKSVYFADQLRFLRKLIVASGGELPAEVG